MTVANAITLFRIALTPVFLYLFIAGERGWAFAIFCVAGLSDLIDGTIARLLKQRSNWGAVLDPIADKVLLESAFICLVVARILPLWFFLLAFTRDLTIMISILYFKLRRISIPRRPSRTSKAATVMQIGTIVVGLAELWRPGQLIGGVPLDTALMWFMSCAAVLIVASGLMYGRMGFDLLKHHERCSIVENT